MKYVALFLFCLLAALSGKSQDLFNISNSKSFAKHLYNTQQFSFAAKEYERIIFMDSTDLEVQYLLIKSYRKAGAYQFGMQRINGFYPGNSTMPTGIQKEYSFLLIKHGNFQTCRNYLTLSSLKKEEIDFFNLSMFLMEQNYKEANNYGQSLVSVENPDLKVLMLLAEEASMLRFKSPGLALGLSAVVPGSGKIYAGQWKDGLFSLLFTSVAAYQAYRGFSQKGIDSPYGWIYSGLSLGFYVGNLYGSYKAVNKYNYQLKHQIDHRAEDIFNHID